MGRTALELLQQKVAALLAQREWSQVQFVEQLRNKGIRRSQAWASRKLKGVQRFGVEDLDLLAKVFGITIPELFFDEYGQWDRRSGADRRKGDRRQTQRIIFDPKIDITATISRLAFPTENED